MHILSTPSVVSISAFDPTYSYTVEFYYIGNQPVKNRALIIDNDTLLTVYDKTINTRKLSHIIPKNTLEVGKTYTIQIQVFDIDGNSSNLSEEILFYCYSTPIFDFSEISNPYRVASIDIKPNYFQKEGETLKSYQYFLYDFNHILITNSDIYYGSLVSHTFYGLENNTQYYVRCVAETAHGISLDTGYVLVNVVYNTIPSNILFQVENHRCQGYISLVTNMTVIGYELENDNYKFNDEGSVTLLDNSVTYKGGFSVEGDFILFIEAKSLPIGIFLKTKTDEFTLSIVEISGVYYCELKAGTYVIYVDLPKAQLITSDGELLTNQLGQKIEVINLNYDDDDFVVFEVKRINNIYNLKAYYKADYLV